MSAELTGSCHCGNLRIRFSSSMPVPELPLRACGCSFCRRHSARSTSDPAGKIELHVAEPDKLTRYRFARMTCEFLICTRCGCYVGALLEQFGSWFATVNVNILDARAEFTQVAEEMDYGDETDAARLARRLAKWTPAELRTA